MSRLIIGTFTLVGLLLMVPASFAQDDHWNRAPAIETPSTDLIAWTYMQQPEPVPPAEQPSASPQAAPQPEPRPETPPPQNQPSSQTQPGQQTPPSEAQGQAQPESPEPAAKTFTGTIAKEGDDYVLKVSDTTSYKLDDQQQAQQFEGQKVQVIGVLDTGSNMIHVQKIESLT